MEHNWIVAEDVHAYAAKYSDQETEVLKALNDATHAEVRGAQMLSGALQGAILSMISQLVQPKFVLELGTYTGYSAICLAAGLKEEGKVHTIDIDAKLNDMRQLYWEKAGLAEKIEQHIGPALTVIPTLAPTFDLVFLDADKGNYIAYFDLLMEILPIGAVIVADNVMFHGEVLQPIEEQGKSAKHIQAFNDHVNATDRVSKVMLPVRDGITIIKKIK
jgi:caffeoyl-CoA O-methyltransferase